MIKRIKTSGVVRESADILSTRIRMDSLCLSLCACVRACVRVSLSLRVHARICVCIHPIRLFVYGSIMPFCSSCSVSRYSVCILFKNFVLHRVRQRRDSPRRIAVFLPFPEFSRLLPCSLIAPRVLANVKQHDVHDVHVSDFPYSLSTL